MYTRGRRLKFVMVAGVVVLALTGFSSSRGHGSSGHHSSGGGCSNSSQDHDTSSTSGSGGSYRTRTPDRYSGSGAYRSRPTTRSSPTASARPLKDGTAVLKHCADADDPYTTVEVSNPNARDAIFTVKVGFKDESGFKMAETTDQVSVPAKSTATHRVFGGRAGDVSRISRCEVQRRADADE
ncbi:hypothetical protein AB0H51_29600 [Streptomyces griseoluteus]|uniref:hypothetical protein n=1 Tax=Streptomyces griseoluteus TaxID=29306 RepID=UPI0033D34821